MELEGRKVGDGRLQGTDGPVACTLARFVCPRFARQVHTPSAPAPSLCEGMRATRTATTPDGGIAKDRLKDASLLSHASSFVVEDVAQSVGECAHERVTGICSTPPLATGPLLRPTALRVSLPTSLRHARHHGPPGRQRATFKFGHPTRAHCSRRKLTFSLSSRQQARRALFPRLPARRCLHRNDARDACPASASMPRAYA